MRPVVQKERNVHISKGDMYFKCLDLTYQFKHTQTNNVSIYTW